VLASAVPLDNKVPYEDESIVTIFVAAATVVYMSPKFVITLPLNVPAKLLLCTFIEPVTPNEPVI